MEGGAAGCQRNTQQLTAAAAQSCAVHVQAMLDFHAMGIPTVDYGNNIRQVAFDTGVKNAFDFPGFVPAYIRPLFCEGKGPFRWVALSGDPEDIYKTDAKIKELFPDNQTRTTGSTWRAIASRSRACRRAFAGWVSASATSPGWRSMKWSRAAN